jgi:hypothetical protein
MITIKIIIVISIITIILIHNNYDVIIIIIIIIIIITIIVIVSMPLAPLWRRCAPQNGSPRGSITVDHPTSALD